MSKNFEKWHRKKTEIDTIEKIPFFHEREIWFCYLGLNVGFEQDGKSDDFLRPVIIFRKFNNKIFWAIPLTKPKQKKKNSPYFFYFSFMQNIESVAILSQIRLIDAKRLARMIGTISEGDFVSVKEKLKELFP